MRAQPGPRERLWSRRRGAVGGVAGHARLPAARRHRGGDRPHRRRGRAAESPVPAARARAARGRPRRPTERGDRVGALRQERRHRAADRRHAGGVPGQRRRGHGAVRARDPRRRAGGRSTARARCRARRRRRRHRAVRGRLRRERGPPRRGDRAPRGGRGVRSRRVRTRAGRRGRRRRARQALRVAGPGPLTRLRRRPAVAERAALGRREPEAGLGRDRRRPARPHRPGRPEPGGPAARGRATTRPRRPTPTAR